jgi:hypothetical protein
LSSQFNIDGSFDEFLLENDEADEDVLLEEKEKNYLTHSLSEDAIAVSKNFDDQCGKWFFFVFFSPYKVRRNHEYT